MIVHIRDTSAQGGAAIYARLRNATGQYWDFTGLSWLTNITANCKTFLAEVADADPATSLYVGTITIPTGGPWIAEVVKESTSAVLGYDTTRDDHLGGIKAKTDNIPASPAAVGDIPTAAAVADAVLDEATAGHQTAGTAGKAISDAALKPSAADNADAIWDEAIAGHVGAGSTGEKLNTAASAGDPWATALPGAYGAGTAGKIVGDNVNATISSRSTLTAQQVWEYATRTLSSVTAIVTGVWSAAARELTNLAAIVDAIWDELLSGHVTAGTAGKALADASAAGDPWDVSLPGTYAAGKAGKILGDNLDAKISSVGGGGAGAILWTLNVTVGGLPVSGVEVWVSTDSAGTNVIAGTKLTDASGNVSFMLDAGTYYSWKQKWGIEFTNPESFVVA